MSNPLNDAEGNLNPDVRKMVNDNFKELLYTDQPDSDGLQKYLQEKIRGMFKLEAQRNDLNFALSGVERGEMTIQDYEDDLSLAISNWIVKDIMPPLIRREGLERGIEELNFLELRVIQDGYRTSDGVVGYARGRVVKLRAELDKWKGHTDKDA